MKRKSRPGAEPRTGRARYAVVLALLVFSVVAATSVILGALHLRVESAPTSSHGVRLLPAPSAPPRVTLPPVATPIDPGQPPASLPAVSAARQAATVAAEDSRIRLLVHDAADVYQPEVIPVQGSLPTLVLTAGSGAYTYNSLVQYGALVMLPHHAGLLLDNVFVSTNARLDLGGPNLRALYLDSSASGFTSIVSWGGNLSFQGTPQHPLTIMGWDRTANSPAPDAGSGRSYIRDVGGRMELTDVRVSALGFWSGRTSGVAWTGSTGVPSTGGASSSTFTDETYGAFVTRGQNVTFDDDLFEFNELDGLHIHRDNTGISVSHSSAVRNGGNGFLVDRATNDTVLNGNVSEHNAGDGFLIDGRPLVTGASASGGSVAADTGIYVENSAALGNLQSGIALEGGSGTVLRGNEVCARIAGIAIRDGASGTVVTGNDVRCSPRAALEIGPAAPQSMISGNTLVNARIGMLIRSSGPIQTDSNRITGATVFGITARGASSHVSGQGNVISGTGFRAVAASADAPSPALSGTQDSGWAHEVKITAWSWLVFHPLALLWLSILALVIGGEIWSRLRRMPPHPYPASTHWRGALAASPPAAAAEPAAVASEPFAGFSERLIPAREATAEVSGLVSDRALVPALDVHAAAAAPQPPQRPRGAHRSPAPASPASEHPPHDVLAARPRAGHRADHVLPGGLEYAGGGGAADERQRGEQLSSLPGQRAADYQPYSGHMPPGDSASRGWFTPPRDAPPPGPDNEAQPKHWAAWAMTPPEPAPPPPDDFAGSVDTRPFPKIEGLPMRPLLTIRASAALGLVALAMAGCSAVTTSGTHSHATATAPVSPPPGSGSPLTTSADPAICGHSAATSTVSTAGQLSHALSAAHPGETIIIKPGVYDGNFVATRSGTAGSPITLCGSRSAVLADPSINSGYVLHLDQASYWRVEGFTVEGGQKGVVTDGVTHDLIYGLYVHGTGDEAIHLRSFSSYNIVSHNMVRDTGLLVAFYGEGIYVGSANKNWCRYSGCQPDRSNYNQIIDNNIADTTAENIDIKEGTTGGLISDNILNGTGMVSSAATSWVNVKGNDWTVEENTGTYSIDNGFSVHQVYAGWGLDNVFRDNKATVNGPGFGIYVQSHHLGTVVACNNVADGAGGGLSNIPCSNS